MALTTEQHLTLLYIHPTQVGPSVVIGCQTTGKMVGSPCKKSLSGRRICLGSSQRSQLCDSHMCWLHVLTQRLTCQETREVSSPLTHGSIQCLAFTECLQYKIEMANKKKKYSIFYNAELAICNAITLLEVKFYGRLISLITTLWGYIQSLGWTSYKTCIYVCT